MKGHQVVGCRNIRWWGVAAASGGGVQEHEVVGCSSSIRWWGEGASGCGVQEHEVVLCSCVPGSLEVHRG